MTARTGAPAIARPPRATLSWPTAVAVARAAEERLRGSAPLRRAARGAMALLARRSREARALVRLYLMRPM
jgi:hypothetical protein